MPSSPASGYGVASVLQSVAAKRGAEVVGLAGLTMVVKQTPYLVGLAMDALAFGGNVLALQRLPLFLVQSIVAASVGVTAVIASLRGAHLSRRDWLSLAVLGVGLIFLSITAVPGTAARISLDRDWLILLLAIVPAVVGLIGFRMKGRASSIVMCCAAGLGFTGVAVGSRGIGADDVSGRCCSTHCSGRSWSTARSAWAFSRWRCSETQSRWSLRLPSCSRSWCRHCSV